MSPSQLCTYIYDRLEYDIRNPRMQSNKRENTDDYKKGVMFMYKRVSFHKKCCFDSNKYEKNRIKLHNQNESKHWISFIKINPNSFV